MTELEFTLLVLLYFLWGILQTKHMYRQGYLKSPGDDGIAIIYALFWPVVYVMRTLFGRD
jgi:hypothetical protein